MCRRCLLLVVLGVLLAGCGGPIDPEQLQVCRRVLPALHPEGSTIAEIRFGPLGAGAVGVRIDYTVQEPNRARQQRFAACRFGGGGLAAGRLDLIGVDTSDGPLGEARLTYLKRYWLADQQAGGEGAARVPLLSPALAYAAQQGVNAIAPCAIYSLLAVAYSLIYGLVGRINLAFGQIAVLGAFGAVAAVAASVALGVADPLWGIALALACAALFASGWSLVVGRAVVGPLHARHRLGQPILVATAAVAIVIQDGLLVTQGVRERWMPPAFSGPIALARSGPFVVTVTPMQLTVAAAALLAAFAVLWLLRRTRFGRQWRAFADDPAAAQLFGVAGDRLIAVTFLIAGALTGLAGWVVAVYYGHVSASIGTMLGLKALVAAVVGGIGSVPGAFLGGVLIGLVEAAWSAYFDITVRDIVVYTILIVVFVLRPGGLLGLPAPSPRQV